jgi:selenide,water dikinase
MKFRRFGCQSKVDGSQLFEILDAVFPAGSAQGVSNPMNSPEDCARLEGLPPKILATCDLSTLVGSDLRMSGRIAALSALADIYASGGRARWAMAILVLPTNDTCSVGTQLMSGLVETCREEGVSIIGGHTLYGTEVMAGLCVLGEPLVGHGITKRGSRPGDLLFLSKPLGTGLALRAAQSQTLNDHFYATAINVMAISNRAASIAAVSAEVNAGTDVSGFGLLGHVSEMLSEGLGVEMWVEKVPLLSGISALGDVFGHLPWIVQNRDYAESRLPLKTGFPASALAPLLDPQTNGGLLVAAHAAKKSILEEGGFTSIGLVNESGVVSVA